MYKRLLSILIVMMVSWTSFPSGSSAQNKGSKTLKKVEQTLDTRAIRTRTNEVYTRFIGNLEEAADGIFLNTQNAQFARRSLVWKISAASAAQHAFFDNDPIIALLDGYAFAEQQREFFNTGAGSDLFGPYQHIVNEFSIEVHEELRTMIQRTCDENGLSCDILASIDEWVGKNKIESLYYNRNSIIEDMAEMPGSFAKGIGKSVVEMAESVQDMSSRMNILSQILPKQMRWEMQLVLVQLEMKKMMDSTLTTMGTMGSMSMHLPDQIDSLQAVSMLQADGIRKNATDAITLERIAMQSWAEQFTDSLATTILEESERWSELMNEQRILAFVDANEMMYSSTKPMQEVIDHLFWRGIFLLVVAFVLFVLASLVLHRIKN